ncbi:hypothetical protein [Diaminobutyricimonas sp. TR449]|uniref:hypothetical protein n=1 Tax=Diaminobutyricimonas sp. TR449 TaxID=2708076 RepID=UPI00141E7FB3|nr:hypothetical protein [Diaminobutyricimonas sp. TR449]
MNVTRAPFPAVVIAIPLLLLTACSTTAPADQTGTGQPPASEAPPSDNPSQTSDPSDDTPSSATDEPASPDDSVESGGLGYSDSEGLGGQPESGLEGATERFTDPLPAPDELPGMHSPDVLPTQEQSVITYQQPNRLLCAFDTVIINAPINVPLSGHILWATSIETLSPRTQLWETVWRSPYHSNIADSTYFTPAPWADPDGNHLTTVSTAVSVGFEPITVRVLNRFWGWDSQLEQWFEVTAFYSTVDGHPDSASTCFVERRP